jgi:hypothetical protein
MRPAPYESAALPTELSRHTDLAGHKQPHPDIPATTAPRRDFDGADGEAGDSYHAGTSGQRNGRAAVRINLHPQKHAIAFKARAKQAHSLTIAARPSVREHHGVFDFLHRTADTNAEPEWFSIDHGLPSGWWRRIADAPALCAVEGFVDSLNPDDWSEEREREMMLGLAPDGSAHHTLPYAVVSAMRDSFGQPLGSGPHYEARGRMMNRRRALRSANAKFNNARRYSAEATR